MKRRINKSHQKLIFAGLFLVTAVIICWLKWPKPSYPDIILITVDALRADHLSAYGYSRKTSPNIDNLAKEGEIFLNCFAVSSQTVYSSPGLFTGRYLAVNKWEPFWVNVFDEKFTTLQRYLKGFGYFTAALVGNVHFKDSKGFRKGFDFFYFNNNGENSSYKLTEEAMKLLNNRRKNKPIFIWLHYMDTHIPYCPLKEYLKIFEKDALFKENDKILCLRPDNLNSSPYSSDGYLPRAAYCDGELSLNYYIARYDAGILSADFCIGNLLNNIKKDTIVILTADHGESLGEHNRYFAHGEDIYEEVLHIPLILRDNKIFTRGNKISEPVSAVDIVPTILSRINPLWYFLNSRKFNGIDLRQVSKGRHIHREYIYSYYPWAWSIRDTARNAKYILSRNGREELYFLPDENNNLINDKLPKIIVVRDELRKKLRSWLMTFPIPADNNAERMILDEEARKQLRNLGYLQ